MVDKYAIDTANGLLNFQGCFGGGSNGSPFC